MHKGRGCEPEAHTKHTKVSGGYSSLPILPVPPLIPPFFGIKRAKKTQFIIQLYYFKKIFFLHRHTEKQNRNNIRHSSVARKRLEEIKIF